jgi:predicted amidohydrolase YtcJ
MADQLGTLQAGKFADLTILEKDPYTVDPDALMSIAVSQTWVGGRKMYG